MEKVFGGERWRELGDFWVRYGIKRMLPLNEVKTKYIGGRKINGWLGLSGGKNLRVEN